MSDNPTSTQNNQQDTFSDPFIKTPKSTSPKFDQIKYPALFVAIGLLFAAGIWILSEIQEDEPEITITKPFTACRTDDECVIVPYRFCCVDANAINKKYEQEYLNNPDLQTAPQSPGICATIECRDADLSSYDAQCINNKCTPILKESMSTSTSNWQTYRNEWLRVEFKYPGLGWKISDGGKLSDGTPTLSIRVADSKEGEHGGVGFRFYRGNDNGRDGEFRTIEFGDKGIRVERWKVMKSKDGDVLTIEMSYWGNDPLVETFNSILSTFEVIEESEIIIRDENSNFTTYRSTNFSFEFTYPDDFVYDADSESYAKGTLFMWGGPWIAPGRGGYRAAIFQIFPATNLSGVDVSPKDLDELGSRLGARPEDFIINTKGTRGLRFEQQKSLEYYFYNNNLIYKFSGGETIQGIADTFRFINKTIVTPTDKQSCEAKGGTWGRFGFAQVELCNLPTSDANKTCTDSSQCESVCVADDNILPDTKTTGKCYDWTETLGTCLNYVNSGKAQGTLCAD